MIHLASGPYRAAINPVGGSIAALTHDGRDLVAPQHGLVGAPAFRGAVLAPWPGRIGEGQYTFGGTQQLPITEPDRRTALHGLVYEETWDVQDAGDATASLRIPIEPRRGYPFSVRLTITYSLSADGLTCDLAARNTGDHPAPYGCGFHPYILPAHGSADDAVLELEADRRMLLDPVRLLPTGVEDTAATGYDFATPKRVGDRVLDDAFTGLHPGAGGYAAAHVDDVEVWWDDALPWLQLYTPADRSAVAVEPYSCPTDAFSTRQNLVVLDPGRSHTVTWGIRLTS